MTHTPDINRPDPSLIAALNGIGSATVAGTLGHMGIRNPHIAGPTGWNPGKSILGPALTLQFMPKREVLYGEDEYTDPERQLHRHVRSITSSRATWSWWTPASTRCRPPSRGEAARAW